MVEWISNGESGLSVRTKLNTIPNNGSSALIREKLTADRTYFVRQDGNDNNTGLSNNVLGAKLTFDGAYTAICNLIDFGGFTVTIQMQTGAPIAWTDAWTLFSAWVGGGALNIDGGSGTLNTINGDDAIGVFGILPGNVDIQHISLSTASGGHCLHVTGIAAVTIGNVTFGSTVDRHIKMDGGAIGFVFVYGTIIISAGAQGHISANGTGATILYYPDSVTLIGTPVFLNFVIISALAYIESTGVPFIGGAIGNRYDARTNSVIETFGSGANYFPGNSPGFTDGTAVYD